MVSQSSLRQSSLNHHSHNFHPCAFCKALMVVTQSRAKVKDKVAATAAFLTPPRPKKAQKKVRTDKAPVAASAPTAVPAPASATPAAPAATDTASVTSVASSTSGSTPGKRKPFEKHLLKLLALDIAAAGGIDLCKGKGHHLEAKRS